jgi:flagellar basal-body rod modification protein FlgD
MSTDISALMQTVNTPATATTSKSTLGKDDFLKLLTEQLQYQDPMNPLSGADFASQLAQFSSVEQLTNINTNLTNSLALNQSLSQAIGNSMSASLIGKDVRVTNSTIDYSGSGAVKFGYTLPSAADSVSVEVQNSSGNTVRTINTSGTSSGDNALSWDGKDDNGNLVSAGNYSVKVVAKDAAGNPIVASPYTFGTISAVRFKNDGAFFVVDGTEVSVANVIEVLGGS